jgi:hypothetical protein
MSVNTSTKEYFEVSNLAPHLDKAENGIRRSATGSNLVVQHHIKE